MVKEWLLISDMLVMFRKIAEVAQTDKIVVEKSTFPSKLCGYKKYFERNRIWVKFEILSNPEFLAEDSNERS